MKFCYDYPRPAVTADIIVFKNVGGIWLVLLIQRANSPFQGNWALPGGFLEMDETLEECAIRELEEETGIRGVKLEQLHTFSTVDRDPRHRTITTAFFGKTDDLTNKPQAGDDASGVFWFPVKDLPALAFDHKEMIEMALKRLNA